MLVYEIVLISVGLNTLINYCIGKPGGDFSPYEIFSNYTIWLSIRKLKKVGLIDTYHKQFQDSVNRIENDNKIIQLRHDYHRVLYNAAEPFFTWERMVGMCSVCTGFWVSLITGIFFTQNLVYLLVIVVVSHLLIRILNKII